MNTILIYDNKTNELIALFRTHQRVMYVCTDAYFKITLDDRKFFLFDAATYSYEVRIGEVVKIDYEF